MYRQLRRMPTWLQYTFEELLKPPSFLQQSVSSDQNQSPVIPSSPHVSRRFQASHSDPGRETESRSVSKRSLQGVNDGVVGTKRRSIRKPIKHRRTIKHGTNLPIEAVSRRTKSSSVETSKPNRRVAALLKQADMPTALIGQYEWDVINLERIANVLRVSTKSADYALKRTHISPEKVKLLYDICDHVRDNGFRRFASFALTKERRPCVVQDGETYYATQWIAGNMANYASTQQIGQIAYALAQFHEASKGFRLRGAASPSEYRLPAMLRHRSAELRQLIAEADRKEDKDEFDITLLRIAGALRRDADKGLRLIEQDDCKQFLQREEQEPGLCHLDVIPSNFVYDGQKQVYLLDLDLAAFAPRALDLAHLLRRGLQLNWSSQVAYAGFLHYNAVRPMEPAEYLVVQALLTFPYRAWRLAHTRYRVFAEDTQVGDLKQFEAQEERRQAFLEAFAKQITRQPSE